MQAKWFEHSLLLTHSGLQFGGVPMYWAKQEHAGESPDTLHSELAPQGDGLHGLTCFGGTISTMLNGFS